MIDVKILKVIHLGDEYRKLLPYVKDSHCFSPEGAGKLEKLARDDEADWELVLRSGVSRSQFGLRFEHDVDYLSPGQLTFVKGLFDYLLRNRVPLWFVERFSEDESKILENIDKECDFFERSSLVHLLEGKVADFLIQYKKCYELMDRSGLIRDRHIAHTIDNSEEAIRSRYPSLSCDPLKFTVCLGYMHQPEKYISRPVTVINASNPVSYLDLVTAAFRNGDPHGTLERNMLITGIYDLYNQGMISKPGDLLSMDQEELIRLVENKFV